MKIAEPTADSRAFARTVIEAAAQAECSERELKEEILKAARAGDSEKVARIVAKWLMQSASEILKHGLD